MSEFNQLIRGCSAAVSQDQERLEEAAAARLKAINDKWSQDNDLDEQSNEEESEDSEEQEDEAPSPTTAASLGIDPRLLESSDGLAKPRIPSYGMGLTLGLDNNHESTEGSSDETEDEMPTK